MENAERIQEEMQKFREELKGLEASKGGTSKEIEEKESQIQELLQTIENSGELFVEIQDEIEKAKKTREDLNQRHKDFLQKREDLSRRKISLSRSEICLEWSSRFCKKSLLRWRVRKTVMKKLQRSRSIIWEEYELTYNRAMELRNEN